MKIRAFAFAVAACICAMALGQDPLPSWNEGEAKRSIIEFVEMVSKPGLEGFVQDRERIAVFDNDGTLWAEQPLYFQLAFAMDRVKALAPKHPEWKEKEPFKSILAGDVKTALAGGEKAALEIVAATHAGVTTEEFAQEVRDWIITARHPTTGKLYIEMTYKPMREVLDYLRSKNFSTFIVSGGGVEFMRPWAERVYGVPPENVIGSSGKTKFELKDGVPVLEKLPEVQFVDDGPGKPAGINLHIGRRPLIAFGNSDGDLQMLQWTTVARGSGDASPRLGVIVHHTDAEREWAYDRHSQVGKLDKALDEAPRRGWVVVDMKADWKVIWRE